MEPQSLPSRRVLGKGASVIETLKCRSVILLLFEAVPPIIESCNSILLVSSPRLNTTLACLGLPTTSVKQLSFRCRSFESMSQTPSATIEVGRLRFHRNA